MVNLKISPDSTERELPTVPDENQLDNVRILLVDDQISIRQSLQISLESKSNLKIVGSATNGVDAIAQVETIHPDVALIDIEMPSLDGLKATQIIKQRFGDTKVIVLSSHDNDKYIDLALKAGAKGYLLKTTPATEIVDAIRYVHKGYLHLGPGLFEKLESAKSSALANTSQNSISSPQIINSKTTNFVKTKSERSESSDWSSMTKELIETLPRVWTRGLLYFLVVLVGIVLPWAMFSKVDETGEARGKLEPQGKVYSVDTPVAGTVDEVFVSEGQSVKNQQPLLSLESEPVESELQQARSKLDGQQRELAQLRLLKNQLVLTVDTQKQQNTAQQFEKQAQVNQARQNIQHARVAQRLAQTAYQEATAEVRRYQTAKEQGVISEIQVVEREDILREKERLLEQAKEDTQQAQLRLSEQEESYQSLVHSGEIAVLKNLEQLKEIEKQIGTIESQIKENKSQIDSLSYQLAQRIVKAPVTGSIFQLPSVKTGTVLEPGGLVAEIAPTKSSLTLKAQMPPTESGSLERGMSVKLKFDAYPFQDYGIVEGEVVEISPTTKVVDTPEGKVENYELEIKLDKDYIQAKNKRVALRPGQTATAEVIVRQRRLIDFVLDPFKKLDKDGLEL